MGRHAGWIALHSGMAGGANVILVPEQEFDIEQVARWVSSGFERGVAPMIVVAEGALPADGVRGAAGRRSTRSATCAWAASAGGWPRRSNARTGHETRAVVLGHLQRGGTPTAFDRVLSTRFGLHAIDAVPRGTSGRWWRCAGRTSCGCRWRTPRPSSRPCQPERLAEAAVFFG